MKIIIIGGSKTYGRHGNVLRLAIAETAYRQRNTPIGAMLQRALKWTDQPAATDNRPAYSAWNGWN